MGAAFLGEMYGGMRYSNERAERDHAAAMAQRECTPEEAQRWQQQRMDGYRAARGDITWHAGPRITLADEPPEIPGECGAQYVARHVGHAWELGYSAAWRYHYAGR